MSSSTSIVTTQDLSDLSYPVEGGYTLTDDLELSYASGCYVGKTTRTLCPNYGKPHPKAEQSNEWYTWAGYYTFNDGQKDVRDTQFKCRVCGRTAAGSTIHSAVNKVTYAVGCGYTHGQIISATITY